MYTRTSLTASCSSRPPKQKLGNIQNHDPSSGLKLYIEPLGQSPFFCQNLISQTIISYRVSMGKTGKSLRIWNYFPYAYIFQHWLGKLEDSSALSSLMGISPVSRQRRSLVQCCVRREKNPPSVIIIYSTTLHVGKFISILAHVGDLNVTLRLLPLKTLTAIIPWC